MKNEVFNPLVSIVIPVYNGSNYVREAIDSALAQTYTSIEVLVVNDGSRDDGATEAIVREYGDRVRYFYKENGGVSSALNLGIRNMRGDYFSWLSHDDVYTPDKVEKSVRALAEIEDKHTLVCCESMHIDKDSRPIPTKADKHVRTESILLSWDTVLMQMLKQGTMNGCALLIHREVFEQAGLFDETLRFNQDSFMWNRIFLKKYSMLCIPDVCVKGRIHDKQLTQTGQSIFRRDCEAMSEYLVPALLAVSTREQNFMTAYMKYNAKYGNRQVVRAARVAAKGQKLLPLSARLAVWVYSVYGAIRPTLRKIYYRTVRRMKTS